VENNFNFAKHYPKWLVFLSTTLTINSLEIFNSSSNKNLISKFNHQANSIGATKSIQNDFFKLREILCKLDKTSNMAIFENIIVCPYFQLLLQ